MAKVKLKHPNESFDSLLRRFKKAVDKDDIIKDFRKHEFFEKPCERKKRARAAAIKRSEKKQMSASPLNNQRKY
jgi:small subunit ribosomal protein S21